MERHQRGQCDLRQVTEQTMDESRWKKDDFYLKCNIIVEVP